MSLPSFVDVMILGSGFGGAVFAARLGAAAQALGKKVLVVEISYSAQFYKYLRTFLDLPQERTRVFKRSGGKNLTVSEVDEQIRLLVADVRSREEVLV